MPTQNTTITTDIGQFGSQFTSTIIAANTEIIQSSVDQVNFLSGLNFQFILSKTPNTDYYLQTVSVPGIALPASNISTPNINRPIPGDHLQFNQLSFTFKVDERLKNYVEIFKWMKNTSTFEPQNSSWKKGYQEVFSDATLVILDSKQNQVATVTFEDIWPTALGPLAFTTTATSVPFITCDATFSYTDFDITLVAQ